MRESFWVCRRKVPFRRCIANEHYTELLETAPASAPREPCRWQFREDWRYSYSEESARAKGLDRGDGCEIAASVIRDGITCRFSASIHPYAKKARGQVIACPGLACFQQPLSSSCGPQPLSFRSQPLGENWAEGKGIRLNISQGSSAQQPKLSQHSLVGML